MCHDFHHHHGHGFHGHHHEHREAGGHAERDSGSECCGAREHAHHHREEARDACDCGDRGGFGFKRQFVSNAEVIEAMKEYLSELEMEAQGVREAIAEAEEEDAEDAPAE